MLLPEAEVRKKVYELTQELLSPTQGYSRRIVWAAEQLGELNHRAAIAPLSEAVWRYRDRELYFSHWEASVMALARINDPHAVRFLIKTFKKTKKGTDKYATIVGALGKVKYAAVIPHLAKIAADEKEHWSVREAAIKGLGNFPHPKTIKLLWQVYDAETKRQGGLSIQLRMDLVNSILQIGKAIEKKPVSDKYSRAMQLVSPHLHGNESYPAIRAAYGAALKGKINPDNARLYVKQLRAQQGNLK